MENNVEFKLTEFPKCPCCKEGVILPLYDYMASKEGQNIISYLRGWACIKCGENIFFSMGQLERKPLNAANNKLR